MYNPSTCLFLAVKNSYVHSNKVFSFPVNLEESGIRNSGFYRENRSGGQLLKLTDPLSNCGRAGGRYNTRPMAALVVLPLAQPSTHAALSLDNYPGPND